MQMGNAVLGKLKPKTILLCTVLFVTGCAARMDNVRRVMLDNNISYALQPIPEHLVNTGIQALFQVKQQNIENQFLMQVEMTPSRLLVSAMTVEGLSLFTVDWHTKQGTLSYDKKMVIEPLRILAELQLVLWPVTAIAQGLTDAKMAVISLEEREISSSNEVVYQIKQHANVSYLINLKQNYSIKIEELERWRLSEENDSAEKPAQSLEQKRVKN